jgi:ribosomal protein L37E
VTILTASDLERYGREAQQRAVAEQPKGVQFHCARCGQSSPHGKQHRCDFGKLTRRQRRRLEAEARLNRIRANQVTAMPPRECPDCHQETIAGKQHNCPGTADKALLEGKRWAARQDLAALRRLGADI